MKEYKLRIDLEYAIYSSSLYYSLSISGNDLENLSYDIYDPLNIALKIINNETTIGMLISPVTIIGWMLGGSEPRLIYSKIKSRIETFPGSNVLSKIYKEYYRMLWSDKIINVNPIKVIYHLLYTFREELIKDGVDSSLLPSTNINLNFDYNGDEVDEVYLRETDKIINLWMK